MRQDIDTNIIYDLETYPNFFSFCACNVNSEFYYYEISERRDDSNDLYAFLMWVKQNNIALVGFNNVHFDYPILHEFIHIYPTLTPYDLYLKAMSIINSDNEYAHIIREPYIKQIDLYKINHFDNAARRTSLKVLQINMRSESVEDLPIKPGTILTLEQLPIIETYNRHDVSETLKFYDYCLDSIKFRDELSATYDYNFTNHNDTKIGKDYFIQLLEKRSPGTCYTPSGAKRQTIRDYIQLENAVLPYVEFTNTEFTRVLNYFKEQVITETKGVFKDLVATVDGFDYVFGVGGIHGSIEWCHVKSDADNIIIDLDVASYYPNLAIANNLNPAHLGTGFCEIYKDLYDQRKQYAKGTPQNAMLKLALNGVYGDSNNKYSPFYDPAYTMAITINGQLLLCMLAERLRLIPGLKMIQINTDGLTVKIPRSLEWLLNDVWQEWEKLTGLTLEAAYYSNMWIRDVNSYVARYDDGKLKCKGAYQYQDLEWHKDHSALIIPRAVVEYLVNGTPIDQTIRGCSDKFDFMIKAKAPRSNYILYGDQVVQSTNRYYVSTDGKPLIKVSPPILGAKPGQYKRKNGISTDYYRSVLAEVGEAWDERIHTKNKSVYTERRTEYQKSYLTTLCNHEREFNFNNVNYQYYIDQADKLTRFNNESM